MELDATQQAEFVSQIARHQSALHAYIISLMPGVDGVDDVLQETNLVLWEKRGTFEPGSNFRAWACAIARYRVMGHRRKLARQGLPLFDDALAEQLAAECEAEPEELTDRIRALEHCLGRLPEKERALIDNRYFSDSHLDEYAAQCGRPVESLRVSLFRIRAALKKCITGELTLYRTRS
jgi:RNA polymerase sigma-70 factor (ECF subfamily)